MYYIYNAHGDVIQLLNASGSVTKTYDYDAYGNELERDLADENPFRYCGEYYDTETGFVYLRARYYDPTVGRFVSKDTHWNVGNMIYGDNHGENPVPDLNAIKQSTNLYAYGLDNPINYKDPTGKVVTPANVIGAVIGAGGGALLGTLIAEHYGLTGWKKAATIAGFAVGGAAIGWFAGPLVERLALTVATKLGLLVSATKELVEKVEPIIGNKLEYLFGNATGDAHNIQRSVSMLHRLESIGIFDDYYGREYVFQQITDAYYNAEPIIAEYGRVIKEVILAGDLGVLKMETIWQGERLITFIVK